MFASDVCRCAGTMLAALIAFGAGMEAATGKAADAAVRTAVFTSGDAGTVQPAGHRVHLHHFHGRVYEYGPGWFGAPYPEWGYGPFYVRSHAPFWQGGVPSGAFYTVGFGPPYYVVARPYFGAVGYPRW